MTQCKTRKLKKCKRKRQRKMKGGYHLYKRLKLKKNATKKQIKQAYKKIKRKTKKIKHAYKILSNTKSRKNYHKRYKH